MSVLTLPDGRQLYYRQAGSGPVLVMLHGWSMSSAVFQEMMAKLSADFQVVAPDLAGHGDSEAGQSDFSHDDLAADIESLLIHLDARECLLLGWSLGGQVALQMLVRGQVAVRKLILVATTPLFVSTAKWPHGLPLTQVRAMDRQMQRHYEQSMSEFFRLMFDGEEIDPERFREIIRFAIRDGSLPDREVARRGLKILGSSDFRENVASVSCPALVHYGSLDLITEPGACSWLAGAIPGAREVCWQEVGHAPFLSRADESAELWRSFLQ